MPEINDSKKKMIPPQLSVQINLDNPREVMDEVESIFSLVHRDFDFTPVERAFGDVRKLFFGKYPGYRKCNIDYHNLRHTTDALLAIARMIHGALLDGERFTRKNITLALITTLFHDTGYIQEEGDNQGTGAKFTLVHVNRSMDFISRYYKDHGFSRGDIRKSRVICSCTGLNTKVSSIAFESPQIEMLGKMLGTADLLGQMADRCYLEKLLYLFYEFKEGNIPGFSSEFDLLKKTLGFFDITKKRLDVELGKVYNYLQIHFAKRWGINSNLYIEAIKRTRGYLRDKVIVSEHNFERFLRRGDVIEDLDKRKDRTRF